MFQKRRSSLLPIAFFALTTFGLIVIVISWFARQDQIPGFRGAESPYAVTLTTDYSNRDYLTNLDMQRISTHGNAHSAQPQWALDSTTAGKIVDQKLPESIKQVKIEASPATLFQAMKGDAEIEMDREGDSVRFRVVKPNPYLKVD